MTFAPDEFAHHTMRVKDIQLRYASAGSGELVVLLHGWPQNGSAWAAVMRSLAERFTVLAPDLRGMGASSKAASGYDTDNLADDIHELVRGLGHERVLLAGHDWGAAVAYSYASQFREHVSRLAIFEMLLPGFGLMEQAMVPHADGEFLWHVGFQSVPDVQVALIAGREDVYLDWFFRQHSYDSHALRTDVIRPYVEAMRTVGALSAGLRYYQQYFTSAAQNGEHRKHRLAIPVLAFGGEASLGDLPRQCLELAADDVRGGVIDRCGHWVCEERPDFVAAQLLSFFSETHP